MDQRQVPSLDPPGLLEALVVELDDVVVFGVDRHDAAAGGDLFHRQAHPPEAQPEGMAPRLGRQDVGGEDLEARKAGLNGLGNLLENPLRQRAAKRNVEGVADVGVVLSSLQAGLQLALDCGAWMDEAEVDMRSGAAEGHP